MRVMKFGGTSVGNAAAIRSTCAIIKKARSARPVVVVSALAGTTDELLKIAYQQKRSARLLGIANLRERHGRVIEDLRLPTDLLDELFALLEKRAKRKLAANKRAIDMFLSFGERFSARIVAACLSAMRVPAQSFDAWEIGMITDENFGSAEPLPTAAQAIEKRIKRIRGVAIVTGFIGKTRQGAVTTLGRGGSDYTAAIIGAAIHADAIEIWKDVDGFMTADPRLVHDAKVVPELSFEEASELAYFGAKVLHPKTIVPTMRANVPVRVLNTFKPRSKGTLIISSFEKRREKSVSIDALAFRRGVSIIHVYTPEFFDGNTIISEVFKLFDDYRINIDMIAMSVASISLVMDRTVPLPNAMLRGLQKIGRVSVEKQKAIVCTVGGSQNTADVAGRMFKALDKHHIQVELISQASSSYSITFVVDEKDSVRALKVLHKEFIP